MAEVGIYVLYGGGSPYLDSPIPASRRDAFTIRRPYDSSYIGTVTSIGVEAGSHLCFLWDLQPPDSATRYSDGGEAHKDSTPWETMLVLHFCLGKVSTAV